MEPRVRYARTADDVSIAYWTHGSGPAVIQMPLMPFSHVGFEWQNPHLRSWYEVLGRMVTVIRYDGRGTGLSQREVGDLSLEAQVLDLAAVVDQVGDDQPVTIMGVFHTGPPAILYAARHPHRVSNLVLWCTYASGSDYWKAAQSEGLRALRQADYALFLRTAAHELIGWADDDESVLYAALMREAVAPEMADALIAATREFDVTTHLAQVSSPTLVLHRRELAWLDIDLGRNLASQIPDAHLVVVAGASPLPGAGETDSALRAIGEFLEVELPAPAATSRGEFRTVLFTDLVEHTAMMASLGDERGRDVLRAHERMTREALDRHGGTEIKALGDGFMASFPTVTAAVDCAISLQEQISTHNATRSDSEPPLAVRIGVNAGEPIQEEGDLYGATVILASRIASMALGGEILVSNAVKELVAGKGFSFSDRGVFEPKGLPDPVGIWAVEWRDRNLAADASGPRWPAQSHDHNVLSSPDDEPQVGADLDESR